MTDTLIARAGPPALPTVRSFAGLATGRPVRDDALDPVLACRNIVDVTHDVKSFVLEPPEPRLFDFRPGQYVTVRVNIDGFPIERCYTISSPPTRAGQLTITVKRVPGGPVSNWLHDHLRVGDTVQVSGPLGDFSTAEHPARKYLFLSGGSGITPLMSMTRTLHDLAADTDVVFVHSARTPDDIIFRHELDAIAAADSGIRVAVVCEQDSSAEQWNGPHGRLSSAILDSVVPDLPGREIFTCGPAAYLSAVREILAELGADAGRCHEEIFTLEDRVSAASPPEDTVGTKAADRFSIEFSRTGRTITCDDDTYVLDAALRAGLDLPSSCGEGVCGTCKCTLLSGRVDMEHAGGIRPREIDEGKILVCCSRPLNNLVIDA